MTGSPGDGPSGGPRRREVVIVSAKERVASAFTPPGSMEDARRRESELLARNNELHPRRRVSPQAYEDVRAELELVRDWIRNTQRIDRGGGGAGKNFEVAYKGAVRSYHDLAAFAVLVFDEIEDLPPLALRLQAEAMESLPDGYLVQFEGEKWPHKVAAAARMVDEDAPDLADGHALPEKEFVRAFARLRARCRHVHAADTRAAQGPFCICGLPRLPDPEGPCAQLAVLALCVEPQPWVDAARSLFETLTALEQAAVAAKAT